MVFEEPALSVDPVQARAVQLAPVGSLAIADGDQPPDPRRERRRPVDDGGECSYRGMICKVSCRGTHTTSALVQRV